MDSVLDINSRQSSLVVDHSTKKALIVGGGGIGSWVTHFCALVGFGIIEIYDGDKIEYSNLNRTLYRDSDVGRFKVDALEELILERRPLTAVIKHASKLSEIKERTFADAYVFDCTDTMSLKRMFIANKDKIILPNSYLKLGYDGYSVTWDMLPEEATFGDDSSYRITNSIFSSASIIAALGVQSIVDGAYLEIPEDKAVTTFDVTQIIPNKINGA